MNIWHNPLAMQRLTACLLACALIVSVWQVLKWGVQRPFFVLQQIKVVGNNLEHVNNAGAQAEVLPRMQSLNKNFFMIDLAQVKSAFEALPWVARASVRRVFPNRLQVELVEHEPIAHWGVANEGRLLSKQGAVFVVNLDELQSDKKFALLPTVMGPAGSEKSVLQTYSRISEWLAPLNQNSSRNTGQIKRLTLSNRYAWNAILSNGLILELGREQDSKTLEARVKRAVEIYEKVRKTNTFDVMDMRYPNGLALRKTSAPL